MDFKMPPQEKSKQLQDEKLEAIAGGKLNDRVKNFSLRNKFVKFSMWVWVAVSVLGVSIGMTMPVRAELHKTDCEGADDSDDFVVVQKIDQDDDGTFDSYKRHCFEGDGEIDFPGVGLTDVTAVYSREDAGKGHVETNKGIFQFWKNDSVNFTIQVGTPVNLEGISLD